MNVAGEAIELRNDDGTFRLASLRKRAAKLWTAIESVSALPGLDLNVNVLPIVRAIQASGLTTLRDIAAALNARGVRTARGGQWHSSTVHNLLTRCANREP
jgi:Recombinase